jgi:hypothetical protein
MRYNNLPRHMSFITQAKKIAALILEKFTPKQILDHQSRHAKKLHVIRPNMNQRQRRKLNRRILSAGGRIS